MFKRRKCSDCERFQSEFGFPITRHETNYLNANLELVEKGVLSPIRLEGWIRATVEDVEVAFDKVPKIKYLKFFSDIKI